jgi:hypothetical protein
VLELEPALGINYLAFSNSIDRALVNLGLDRREIEEPTLKDYIEAKYGKAEGQGEEKP